MFTCVGAYGWADLHEYVPTWHPTQWQGVALSAAKNSIKAVIVMPLATPQIKVNAVRSFGGPTVTIKLHGRNYDEAAEEAKRLSREEGLTMVAVTERFVLASLTGFDMRMALRDFLGAESVA